MDFGYQIQIQKFINTPHKHLNHPRKPRQIQGEFDKSKVLITMSTGARGILKPKSVIPRESGGLGF